ncbi:MAG: TIGR01777 family oxidoreductase [Candidatus Cyclonatronum sp.]|uniref:TIGR01777 family oxidoreductase n=1 Tax=Cyclonatronum sp. TaxID=3024185 RepID=UPI0025C06344|nr:TIGR01777 family oxidoreductase [Cyclonatronum sp.]MCC5934140.1 TIGR01777 family oxidoreductase [Balneolales bacterium]MCH8486257.1 TIGR01777 family oxidoreductase [Cyclonatronum sp.]
MHISITGGTGLVGTALVSFLLEQGHEVTIFTRNPGKHSKNHQKAHLASYENLPAVIEESDAVVNLAGENLFDQRWNEVVKSRILKSRVKTTRAVVCAIGEASRKPQVLISASAVGYYGSRGDTVLDESSSAGDDFLARVCLQWEEEADEVRKHGVRLAIPRIGIVLDKSGGALEKMKQPFSMFIGGPLGNGSQFFPWVHVEDVCRAIYFAISDEQLHGAFNLSAPDPITMKEFAQQLGSVMGRPSLFPVPEFALRLVVGDAAEALVASQRTVPRKLHDAGFQFTYPNVYKALNQLLES